MVLERMVLDQCFSKSGSRATNGPQSFKAWVLSSGPNWPPRGSVVPLYLIYNQASWNFDAIPSIYTMITSHCGVNLLSDVVRDTCSVSATSAWQLLVSCNCCQLSRKKGWKVTRGVCELNVLINQQPNTNQSPQPQLVRQGIVYFAHRAVTKATAKTVV